MRTKAQRTIGAYMEGKAGLSNRGSANSISIWILAMNDGTAIGGYCPGQVEDSA